MSAAGGTACAEPACQSALALFERIGHDHALALDGLGDLGREAGAAARPFWAAYEEHWRRFCGARLDPQFWHLDHPARQAGSVSISDGAPVVIVGTGPSLRPMLARLRRIRTGVHLFTSPRGADALAEVGIVPDLLLVEHQSPLDAHFTERDRSHRDTQALARAPLVAADVRTPAALLAGVSCDRTFVPDPLPTWGLWPATAVALALASGTHAVALVGIDLGTVRQADPAQAPLRALLALLAAHTDVHCVDASPGGAPKPGWHPGTFDVMAEGGVAERLALTARPWLTVDARHDRAMACWHRLGVLIAQAEATLAAACRVRDGDRSPTAVADLHAVFGGLIAAGESVQTRMDVQDGLGASFVSRFWRTPPDPAIGTQLWRPAALAAHELVRQHASLGGRLAHFEGRR
jgi:hypothetical protein